MKFGYLHMSCLYYLRYAWNLKTLAIDDDIDIV